MSAGYANERSVQGEWRRGPPERLFYLRGTAARRPARPTSRVLHRGADENPAPTMSHGGPSLGLARPFGIGIVVENGNHSRALHVGLVLFHLDQHRIELLELGAG